MHMPALSSPVEHISDFLHIQMDAHHRGSARTPPGHVLHYLFKGHYQLTINGHLLSAKAGDYIIYHDIEEVEWIENNVAVDFYSIVFTADDIPYMPFDKRIKQAQLIDKQRIAQAYIDFHAEKQSSFEMFSLLYDMLTDFYSDHDESSEVTQSNDWRQLEQQLRRQQSFRPTLNQCTALSGMSSATLSRTCHATYGQSPMQRLQFIRIEQAKSLLQLSPMNISQIANFLDYPRVHEFSREFKQQTGESPKVYRARIQNQ